MVIEKILKQLTPERKKKEIESIKNIKLPKELQEWVKRYEKVGKRSEFFWKFIYKLNGIINPFNFSNESTRNVKTLFIVFLVLIDDVAEKPENGFFSNNLLESFYKNSFPKTITLTRNENNYLKFSIDLWTYIQKRIKKYSYYKKIEEIFYFDIKQIFNAIEYSHLVNKHTFLINEKEHWAYSPYTLQGMINCDIDLMNNFNLKLEEMGVVREIFLSAQKLARITNCFATWEREIEEGDITNSLFVYAIEYKILKIEDLNRNKEGIIKKIKESNINEKLLKEWEFSYNEINILCKKIKSIKSKVFLSQLEELSLLYLLSGSLSK
jgi:hypothetical protein